MKVLAGAARGVPLKTVPDMDTRPILDRIKKSLFSILESSTLILDARVIDLYAGTGTQGIEALSRGAESCIFVERRADAVKLLNENLAKSKLSDRATVQCTTVGAALERLASRPDKPQFDLILYDPPFSFIRLNEERTQAEAEMALAGKFLYPGHARLVLRCERKAPAPAPLGLSMVRQWADGPHAFLLYARVE